LRSLVTEDLWECVELELEGDRKTWVWRIGCSRVEERPVLVFLYVQHGARTPVCVLMCLRCILRECACPCLGIVCARLYVWMCTCFSTCAREHLCVVKTSV